MGVYIKGMDMPKVCGLCPFALSYAVNGLYTYCLASKDALGRLNIETRHPNCPLISVPDHGDLIDREYITKTAEKEAWYWDDGQIYAVIEKAPAVIPAERSKDGQGEGR